LDERGDKIIKIRQQIAHLLLWIAAWVYPCRPGFCFVKNLFDGWVIIDTQLIRQEYFKKDGNFRNGFTWECWTLPEKFQFDLMQKTDRK